MTQSIPKRDDAFRPGATALLLVDLQRAWLEPGADPDHPGTPTDYFYQETARRVVPNVERLLKSARASGVEVIHTIIRSQTRDGRDRSLDHKMTPIHLGPDDPLALPVPSLAPVGDEILLPKSSSGVFNSTNLHYLLRNMGVQNLVVVGIMTDQCVDMAVRDGADLGYMITCVADACAAKTQQRHDNALKAFGGYCWTANTDTVAARFDALRS